MNKRILIDQDAPDEDFEGLDALDNLPPRPEDEDFEDYEDPENPDEEKPDEDEPEGEESKPSDVKKEKEPEELSGLRSRVREQEAVIAALKAARQTAGPAVQQPRFPEAPAYEPPRLPTRDEWDDDPVAASRRMFNIQLAEFRSAEEAKRAQQQQAEQIVYNHSRSTYARAAIEMIPELGQEGSPQNMRFRELYNANPANQNDPASFVRIAGQMIREQRDQEGIRKARSVRGTMHGAGRGSEAGSRTRKPSSEDMKALKSFGIDNDPKAVAAFMRTKYGN